MNFPGLIRSSVTETPPPGVGDTEVQQDAIRRLTRKGATGFDIRDGAVRFRVAAMAASSSNPLRLARGGMFRVTRMSDEVRIDYEIDLTYLSYGTWAGAAVLATVGVNGSVRGNAELFGPMAVLYCIGVPFTYALSCSQVADLFKLAIRKPKRP